MINEQERVEGINQAILIHKDLGGSTKDISDKWHTFGELYYHRMILFLTIQEVFRDRAWKSKQHHDGTMFDDSFIVGIETPKGQYSYHYHLKYWDLFKDVPELDKAPEYDGHKPEDIDRLLSLFDYHRYRKSPIMNPIANPIKETSDSGMGGETTEEVGIKMEKNLRKSLFNSFGAD